MRLGFFRNGGTTWSEELRHHGERGVEAQILKRGELVIGAAVRHARPGGAMDQRRAEALSSGATREDQTCTSSAMSATAVGRRRFAFVSVTEFSKSAR